MPTLSSAKQKAQSIAFLNNLKQLQLAWIEYAHDHNDNIVPMTTMDKNGTLWQSVAPSWVLGCAQTDTNLTDITDGLLFEFPGPRWWGKTPENAADWLPRSD